MGSLKGISTNHFGAGIRVGAEQAAIEAFDERVRKLRRSEKKKLQFPKSIIQSLPPRFSPTPLALPREGAIETYRDNRPQNSIHVVEYPDSWEIHEDKINPDQGAMNAALHALIDAPEETAEAIYESYQLLKS